MQSLDNSGVSSCFQEYQDFMNPVNELAVRMQSANRWCSYCSREVQHWYDDICVDLSEGSKVGHLCASNGRHLCYFVAEESSVFNATELAITCGLEYSNGTSTDSLPNNCSHDCKRALQQAVNLTGCCFESAFNVTGTPNIERRLASYELWDSCGLNTNEIDYCSERIGTRNCTESDLFQYLQTLAQECVSDFVIQLNPTTENFNDRVDASQRWCRNCAPTVYNWLLNECGDAVDALEIAHVCGHNGNINCFHYMREARFYQMPVTTCGLRSADNQTYLPFPSTCPDGCADALQEISNNLGCCFESVFNISDTLTIQLGLANYNLWRTCGLDVDSVDFCTNPFESATLSTHTLNVCVTILTVLVLFLI